MPTVRAFLARIAGLFRRRRRERELSEEFESHFEMHVTDNICRGMSESQAVREARLKFGSVDSAKEAIREGSTVAVLETIWQDLWYALRGMRANPGFAAAAILSLALGIGASVAIFTLADNLQIGRAHV